MLFPARQPYRRRRDVAPGLSERGAIAHARALALKRMRPIDALEVWDGPHLIIRRQGPSADGPLGNSPGREPNEISP
jgi:hypothetical protein